MKKLLLTLALAVLTLASSSAQTAKRVAYIYGDIADNGTIPSGSLPAFQQMLLSDSGAEGCSVFRDSIQLAGYQIDQYYDQATTLDSAFLNQFSAVVFATHQKIISTSERTALDTWMRAGGGILVYNDSSAGGDFHFKKTANAHNTVGQMAVNSIISQYGMQVLVDQSGGTIILQSGPNATHPIVAGNLRLQAEGVCPVAIDPTMGAQILIPYLNTDPEFYISGNMRVSTQTGLTITNPLWAALAVQTVGAGHVVAMFDRQPVWNLGPNANITSADNKTILVNIVKFLAGDLGAPVGGAPIGSTISLKATTNGKYVTADTSVDPAAPLHANSTTIGTAQKFKVVDAGGGLIALRSQKNNLFVSADKGIDPSAPLVANRTAIGSGEQFTWSDAGGGRFSLKANRNGKFVSADPSLDATTVPLVANRRAVGSNETFSVGQ